MQDNPVSPQALQECPPHEMTQKAMKNLVSTVKRRLQKILDAVKGADRPEEPKETVGFPIDSLAIFLRASPDINEGAETLHNLLQELEEALFGDTQL